MNIFLSSKANPRGSVVDSKERAIPSAMRSLVLYDQIATNLYVVDGIGGYDAISGAAGSTVVATIGLPGATPLWTSGNWTRITSGWAGIIAADSEELEDLFETDSGPEPEELELVFSITNSLGKQVVFANPLVKVYKRYAGTPSASNPLAIGSVGGHIAIVDAVNGDDIYGAVNGAPFLTCTAAKTASPSGTTIVVRPGTYNENNLLKNGVNWYFMPGAKIIFAASMGSLYGIFDDRSTGAVTCAVQGSGEFTMTDTVTQSGQAGNTNLRGAITITNSSSNATFKGKSVTLTTYNSWGAKGAWAIWIENSTLSTAEFDNIIDGYYGIPSVDPADGTTPITSAANGIYWGLGEAYFDVKRIQVSQYGIWNDEADSAIHTANGWYNVNYLEGGIAFYTSAHSNNYKTWIVVKEAISTSGAWNYLSTPGTGTGGKHYVTAQKIQNTGIDDGAFTLSAGEVWLTAQKLTANLTGVLAMTTKAMVLVAGGKLHADIEQFEDLGTSTAIRVTGGAAYVRGIEATMLNHYGVSHEGGTLELIGMKIDTSTTNNVNNPAILVSSSGLSLRNCVLVTGALANSIKAASGQTIKMLGPCCATYNKHANITLSPNAGFTVDTAVS